MMLSAATSTIKRQDDEHDVALDIERIEKGLIALAPVGHDNRPRHDLFDLVAHGIDIFRIVEKEFDDAYLLVEVEEGLRLRQRHIDENAVEFGHADLEDRHHLYSS